MRVLKYLGRDRVQLIEVPPPVSAPGDVLVRVEASALCGSERSALKVGVPGAPHNAGHEAVGVIEAAPPDSELMVGDRVGVSALAGCAVCPACVSGNEQFCVQGVAIQTGMHAEFVSVTPASTRPIPRDASASVATLLVGDGLGVPVRALNRFASEPGDRVIVLGLGPVGLSHVLVRAHAGANVVTVEPSAFRRDLALRLGAVEVHESISDLAPAPLVIESTGIAAVVEDAFALCSPQGTVFQSGECGTITVDASRDIVHREIAYIGSWFYGRVDFPRMVELYERGLRLDQLITHAAAAEDAQPVIDAFVGGRTGKVVFYWT